jgi:hypothetical protein
MPESLFLLVPLLAGYWFLHGCHLFQFRAQRLEGYRLLFDSLLIGSLFAFEGRVVSYSIVAFIPYGSEAQHKWFSIAPPDELPYSGTALIALGLAFLALTIVNNVVTEEEAYIKTAVRYGDEMLRLFIQAASQQDPVILTLENRKVYVGYVVISPSFRPKDSYVSILPVVTGYRDPQDLRVNLTVDYISLWEKDEILKRKFETVIPIDSIRAAHIFDATLSQGDFAMQTVTEPQAAPDRGGEQEQGV